MKRHEDDDSDTNRWDWFQALMSGEKTTHLTPEAKLIVLRNMILDCQKKGVERVLRRTRVRLKCWRYFALGTAALRLICMIALLVILYILRYNHLKYAVDIMDLSSNLSYRMAFEGSSFCLSLIVSSIVMEIFLMFSFQIQRSTMIALLYAFNFVLVLLLITMGPFIAGLRNYIQNFTADIFGYLISQNNVRLYDVERIHRAYECCGFMSTQDWISKYLYNFKTLLTNQTIAVANDFGWLLYCALLSNNQSCSVPHFCCEVDHCEDVYKIKFPFNLYNSTTRPYEFFMNNFYSPNVTGTYRNPCFTVIADQMEVLLAATTKLLVVLAIFTIIMTVLVSVVLLYNSGQGELLPHLNRVRSTHADSLVWFFKRIDGQAKSVDDTLSDYSFIQDLKGFNVDKDLTDMD